MVKEKLVIQNLSKKYGNFFALKPTSFTLHMSETVILSGPNGSGKTTLLSCLSGLVKPSTGEIHFDGLDLNTDETEFRRRLCFVPDVPRFYTELTAWEHLRFIAMAHGGLDGFESRAEDVLKLFGLWDSRNHYPHHYSRGMQLKLGLALGLIRPFEVLLLDEPTSALDTESVNVLIEKLGQLRAQGTIIMMSTHDLNLINILGDRQIILEQGALREA